ncbi:hypothetical protein NDU88_001762 [Pleurodeles waltl]|uniref:Uncharacterized protein n=1 Tax=Pleurodeles waltl TaxID=8319 RepID=A0AAV7LYX7_PLEWA|nr:hypothetical protein NDU88_001761 [Pleurodeles waltl]KAJ1096627.1 hypothetical protein NDU88_001762 [Pleurodeles waltl]
MKETTQASETYRSLSSGEFYAWRKYCPGVIHSVGCCNAVAMLSGTYTRPAERLFALKADMHSSEKEA